jgi:DNA-binding SARP family transcriptional activator/TolB-like protein
MSKLNHVTLRLLGTFAIEAAAGRTVAISIRSKKARALLAYLAMKQDYQASREELATLLWGDNPDALARHSLRQCLLSLRQDLSFAAEVLIVDRETVGLSPQFISVDARAFMMLAQSEGPDELARAAELWRGPFLPDLTLDVEEFESWQRQEATRLSSAAGVVFETLCRFAVASGDGDAAIAAAERLAALDPTREDWQRNALKLLARQKGREAAMGRAKQFLDLLRLELGVAPEAATRTLIEAIKRGDFEPAAPAGYGQPAGQNANQPISATSTATLPQSDVANVAVRAKPAPATQQLPDTALTDVPLWPFWRDWPHAAIQASVVLLSIVTIAVLVVTIDPKPRLVLTAPQRGQTVAVLPFIAEASGDSADAAFAPTLTHNLISYLSRFENVRVISEQTSQSYRAHATDIANLRTDLSVKYAIVGRVQRDNDRLKIDLQLVDTATRTNIWSDVLQRVRTNPTLVADETARGIARMVAFEIGHLGALRAGASPAAQLSPSELVSRGYGALQNGTSRENLSDAMTSFGAALRRDPRYRPALLAVARVQIVAAMNFVDLDPPPDLTEAERLVNESLAKAPNSVSALYSLALLQKYRRQYHASMRSMQRCLDLNPSFLPAQGQIGNILTRMGEPEKGLEQILQTIRVAVPDDPTVGYWYLFAAEAELELGHDQAALDWALRANTAMPEASLVHAWLASIYATIGDKTAAAKYTVALTKAAPMRTQLFLRNTAGDTNGGSGRHRPRIFDGLRLALNQSPG